MTDQRTNYCTLCMLIPFILGVAVLTALYWYTKDSKAEYLENDLSIRSNQLLKDRQVGGAVVNVNGRDATLTGIVVSVSRSQEIEQIVATLPGIRLVDNQLRISQAKIIKAAPEPGPEKVTAPEPIPESEPEPIPESEPVPEIALAPEPEPKAQAEVVEELLQTLDLSGITFLSGSNEITPQGKLILDEVVNVLAEHTEFDVVIEGHTDSVGDDNLNFELSQQRAQSVLNHLASTGIQAERLTAAGLGESQPIADNDTKEGRSLNRRIEFTVRRE